MPLAGLEALPGRRSCRASGLRSGRTRSGAGLGAPLALAGVLLGLALLVAPEQPGDQEAICHRHNGVAACRVW